MNKTEGFKTERDEGRGAEGLVGWGSKWVKNGVKVDFGGLTAWGLIW